MTELTVVTGGTGTLGRPVVDGLLQTGSAVRVASRGACPDRDLAYQWAQVDYRSESSTRAAMASADTVVLTAISTAAQTLVRRPDTASTVSAIAPTARSSKSRAPNARSCSGSGGSGSNSNVMPAVSTENPSPSTPQAATVRRLRHRSRAGARETGAREAGAREAGG